MASEAKILTTKAYPAFSPVAVPSFSSSVNTDRLFIIPGFCDVHVHFREPGFSYKETIATGSLAAAAGGYTDVCTMPNLKPVPDSREHLKEQLDIIRRDAVIGVHPFGAVTVGEAGQELSDLAGMAPDVIGFSDDGKGVQRDEMMRDAMLKAKNLGKIISAHCEVNELLHGGCIHDGIYARTHGHPGICSESEWRMIERDVRLAEETGCAYHVCHISCRESVEIIRDAKKRGVDVTCETGPHYLVMDENDLQEEGRFKMNPPLRSADDRKALVEGILDGTIDCIATDHAPHSAEEKAKGLEKSAFGITGIETAFPVLYTDLVLPGIVPLEKILACLIDNPRRRFGLPLGDDYSVWDLSEKWTIDPDRFVSMGHATPFAGKEVTGRCLMTVRGGRTVWERKSED